MARKHAQARTRSDGAKTRNRILDVAEGLFAVDGFAAVSVRQITAAAEIDIAQVNYYFGSKDQLFHEVLIRRIDDMSRERLSSLEKIEIRKHDRKTVEGLLEAFLMPIIGRTPDKVQALRPYRKLIALVTNSRTWQEKVFKEHYDPVAARFIAALIKALPGVPKPAIYHAFSFFLGGVVNALAETGRIDRLSKGTCRSSDLDGAAQQLINFYAGGFMSLLPPVPPKKRRVH